MKEPFKPSVRRLKPFRKHSSIHCLGNTYLSERLYLLAGKGRAKKDCYPVGSCRYWKKPSFRWGKSASPVGTSGLHSGRGKVQTPATVPVVRSCPYGGQRRIGPLEAMSMPKALLHSGECLRSLLINQNRS